MSRKKEINAIIERLASNSDFMAQQNEAIAEVVLFYSGVLNTLKSKVPSDALHQVTATLTAAYWSSSQNCEDDSEDDDD